MLASDNFQMRLTVSGQLPHSWGDHQGGLPFPSVWGETADR